ncbi:hypothetical protein J1N35_028360 [Gossypium stocksii]|uniref:N-acetyltransferase domain-containing protein n=1 Tax=Gossypium stocksii TaxID=47602 RepID=A0A9D3UW34_9ROSI|nr:hypothetical protein J1N35_028360 [Gossypium stocksii]
MQETNWMILVLAFNIINTYNLDRITSGFTCALKISAHVQWHNNGCLLQIAMSKTIPEIYLHVQTNKEDAINFYKKFGLEITETVKKYLHKH